ncbi:MAG: cytochrome c [Gammaproteobacteria bacterium]|nr:cytochrome c [Gammaproteobacteria bacterium]
MKIIKIICLPFSLLFLNSAGWSQSANDWESGEQIFDKVCQYCHINDVGPILTGRNLPPIYFSTIARNGQNAMPAFRPTELSAADLEKVANFLSQSLSEENQ